MKDILTGKKQVGHLPRYSLQDTISMPAIGRASSPAFRLYTRFMMESYNVWWFGVRLLRFEILTV